MANKVKLMGAVVAIGALGATGAAVGFADDIDRTVSSNEEVQQEVQQLADGAQQPAKQALRPRPFKVTDHPATGPCFRGIPFNSPPQKGLEPRLSRSGPEPRA